LPMALDPSNRFPLMAITQSGIDLGHVEQVEALCAAGVRWIQLRMKEVASEARLAAAGRAAAVCRDCCAILIVNDSVEVALEVGADGVHLGRTDLDWREARARLGPDRILGGTVNYVADAERAVRAGCLDYIGVGPVRFTRTKKELAPIQGFEGAKALSARVPGVPAWAIGGLEASDLPALRAAGFAGAAVCSALFRGGKVAENVRVFLEGWPPPKEEAPAAERVSSP
jgi:thiamine-phosphate pyrophosphorylase